jgi:hypothetical protein
LSFGAPKHNYYKKKQKQNMVDTNMIDEKEQAEKLKQLGNAEFKK